MHSSITILVQCLLLVSIISSPTYVGHHLSPGRSMWVDVTSSPLLSSKHFCWFSSFYPLSWAEPCIFSLTVLICLTQQDIHDFFINLGRNIYTTTWYTQLLTAVYLNQRASPLQRSHISKKSCGQSHSTLFSDLQRHITLVHLLWDFHFRVLFISHMTLDITVS